MVVERRGDEVQIHSRGEDRRLITEKKEREGGKYFTFTKKYISVKLIYFVWKVQDSCNHIVSLLISTNNS